MTEQMELTLLSEGRPAKTSASQDFAREWLEIGETSPSPILTLLQNIAPDGWSTKTSPASCHLTKDGILEHSSPRWGNAGMGSHGEALTLSTPDWHSDASVCSLSDTLETGDVPPQFYLSARACQGILRRAEKRGKKLPEQLQRALEAVAAVE
jgi:hypothetical protein